VIEFRVSFSPSEFELLLVWFSAFGAFTHFSFICTFSFKERDTRTSISKPLVPILVLPGILTTCCFDLYVVILFAHLGYVIRGHLKLSLLIVGQICEINCDR
jgi:hypothetical protein